MIRAFETEIEEKVDGTLTGPWRMPRQMLMHQEYGGHASIHNDATARLLGFKGVTIEGPTHFSQFEPVAAKLWGLAWFETGCISAHYRTAAFNPSEPAILHDRSARELVHRRHRRLRRQSPR